ncbi:hypothetical protein SAMN02910298_00900 [Pseudobutyrivibrio sp. YE44]|uniref:GH36-type glycosyl hydrolase domain-containing protein n=1 Tax=Pseudobutyrivibrio sp. YE44 TaxID=1520802 RepID=UPI00088AA502|nr:cellobiose phosphorylase [Pseudobutyrivibrio sp. YE44]SDB19604.1 hypothetical protein SAMN02910298_00900 [Pseudobutyrivibrio sp. YE44]
MSGIEFIDKNGSFKLNNPNHTSGLYLPLASLVGLKSAVTPDFNGDAKIDYNHFLISPKSIMNLSTDRDTRNFFLIFNEDLWSVTGVSAEQEANRFTDKEDSCSLKAGRMWQTLERTNEKLGVKASTTIFPLLNQNAEIMQITVTNESDKAVSFQPVAAIPLFGRSADNLRDHRHVTSLLNRAVICQDGVVMKPTLSFDERGHQKNDVTYFVFGCEDEGKLPVAFIADAEKYLGEGGTYLRPRSLLKGTDKTDIWKKPGDEVNGKETVGVMGFEKKTIGPQESVTYQLVIGLAEDENISHMDSVRSLIRNKNQVDTVFNEVKDFWNNRTSIHFKTGNQTFDNYMEWICFQPELRRIFGCSFLPHHDYGKGGRGWRDLWQDCLALLLMNSEVVREMILSNFKGVRLDGTNATIIGSKPGEFKADRNGISRVWMDHGFWPFLTVKLYMDQTGDLDILNQEITYFSEKEQKKPPVGTVFEHILLENLAAFYDVGEHNQIKLRNADWNDALDMAADRGESVAFTCGYAGNLKDIATYLRILKAKSGITQMAIATEMLSLLYEDSLEVFSSPIARNSVLDRYKEQIATGISGDKELVDIEKIALLLEHKSDYLMKLIRREEWVEDGKGNGWYNGYYDNLGRKVEGCFCDEVRMMLTGQVFSIMSGTAKNDSVLEIIKAADKYLFREKIGGYVLNTDFKELRTDLGRMFGFSYGDKENGAVFSHMSVMYGNALYQRGFVEQGYKSLITLFKAASNFEKSKIYPGIPEYFNGEGRGLYNYLTGAASWYLLTMVTQVFGVRGSAGDLHIEPKLLSEQFDKDGVAEIKLPFRGHSFVVRYINKKKLNYGEYTLGQVILDGTCKVEPQRKSVTIPENWILNWNEKNHVIEIELK